MRRSTIPRIQDRADASRCGWGAKFADDRVFAGDSSLTMEAPVACDRTTIPAMASCETDPVIATMEERKRAVAGIRNLRVIRSPANGKGPGGTSPDKGSGDPMPPGIPVYPVLEASSGRASRLHILPDHVLELGSDLELVHRFGMLHHGLQQFLLGICRKRHSALHLAGVVAAIDVFPCHHCTSFR